MTPSYSEYVDAQIPSHPCLKGLADFLHGYGKTQVHPTKFSSIDFAQGNCQNPQSWEIRARDALFTTASFGVSMTSEQSEEQKLQDILDIPSDAQGRVLIIEDMDRHIASYLGARYDISPFFFANHLHNSFSNFEERPPLGSLTIPSIHCKGKSIHLHYRRVIDLGPAGRESSKQTCLVFVDPTNAYVRMSTDLSKPCLKQVPLHGGGPKLGLSITKFSKWQSNSDNVMTTNNARNLSAARASNTTEEPSLRDILIQCFQQPSPDFDAQDPSLLSLAYHPIRIVISEWNFYTMLLSRYVEHYEYALISSEASVQLSNLEELLPWRRRCARSLQRLCLLRVFIESHLQDIHNEKLKSVWTPVLQDIDHFSSQISNWATFLGSMVSQLDTHQSLIEARSVRRFTYVVLAFTALSLVTSIFSMTDEVLPWGSRFWIYVVIAVPFTLFVLLGYFTLSRNLGRA
ncbi:hypothetical protein AALT_g6987 [Alternaria alternata]|nr:hypothetical protein AALT_g6987 [Alternaria alternata]